MGRHSLEQAIELQNQCVVAAARDGQTRVQGFELEPVITLGRRARVDRDLLATGDWRVARVNRGGEATLHMPGQLVIFPTVALRRVGLSVRQYVTALMEVTRQTLAGHGVRCESRGGQPGLYTHHGKIAFFGLQVQRGIASHGLAINVSNEVTAFAAIRSCGVAQAPVDALARHGLNVKLPQLFANWCEVAAKILTIPGGPG